MLDRIFAILETAGGDSSHVRSTELYNEGWMLRLILDWAETRATRAHPLFFESGARWFSEALLPSQFLSRRRGDGLAESWTHADGAIGHFQIGCSEKADLVLESHATQLVVVEAKMFSGLSAGVKHAPEFNQAARTVACIAEVLRRAGRPPDGVPRLAFYVIAPAEQLERGVCKNRLEKVDLLASVAARVQGYGSGKKDEWWEEWFKPTLTALDISALDWESLVDQAGSAYRGFYERCVQFNRPQGRPPVTQPFH